MNNGIFLTFSIFLTALIYTGYITFEHHFRGYDLMEKKVKILVLREKQSELKQKIAEYQLRSFKQEVASVMPEYMKEVGFEEDNYPIRTLSSVVKKKTDTIDVALGETYFVRAKNLFHQKQFKEAAALFEKFITFHSYSVNIAEAQFLLAESRYQLNELDQAVSTIEGMIQLFPENDLTGLALIRFGKILETQDRNDEAQIIYKTVLQTFNHPDVVNQAKKSLRSI
ncbi:MAG: tetratricopeptide repeat protein [Bdellovibrionales bacterium]